MRKKKHISKIAIFSGIDIFRRTQREKRKQKENFLSQETLMKQTEQQYFFEKLMRNKLQNGKISSNSHKYSWRLNESTMDKKGEFERIKNMVSRKFGSVDHNKMNFLKEEIFGKKHRKKPVKKKMKKKYNMIITTEGSFLGQRRKKPENIVIEDYISMNRTLRSSLGHTKNSFGVTNMTFDFPTIPKAKSSRKKANENNFKLNFEPLKSSKNDPNQTPRFPNSSSRRKKTYSERDEINFNLIDVKMIHQRQTQSNFAKLPIKKHKARNLKKRAQETLDTELAINTPAPDLNRFKLKEREKKIEKIKKLKSKKISPIKLKGSVGKSSVRDWGRVRKSSASSTEKKFDLSKLGTVYRGKYGPKNSRYFSQMKQIVRESFSGVPKKMKKKLKKKKIFGKNSKKKRDIKKKSLIVNCKTGLNGIRLDSSLKLNKGFVLRGKRGYGGRNRQNYNSLTERKYDKVKEKEILKKSVDEWSVENMEKNEMDYGVNDYVKSSSREWRY